MDPSYSMVIDKTTNTVSDYSAVTAQSPQQWVDDNTGICFQCKTAVGIGLLGSNRSHCRLCGRLHCSKCSNHFAVIPFYITVPKPSKKHALEDLSKPVRLCTPCHSRVQNLVTMGGAIGNNPTTGTSLSLDIFDLQKRAQSTDSFERQWANFKLSCFRSIQYCLVDHKFSQEEREMLWINRVHLRGHNRWMVQLLRSIDFDTISSPELDEIESLLAYSCAPLPTLPLSPPPPRAQLHPAAAARIPCSCLMCSRMCRPLIDVETAIQLLNQKMRCDMVRLYALRALEQCDYQELACFVPYLVRHSMYAKLVYEWLIEQCKKSDLIALEVYWEFQVYLIPDPQKYAQISPSLASFDIIHEALLGWKRSVSPAIREKVFSSEVVVNTIRTSYWKDGPDAVNFTKYSKFGFFFPCGYGRSHALHVDKCKVLDSATGPILINVHSALKLPIISTLVQVRCIHSTSLENTTDAEYNHVPSLADAASLSYLWKPEDVRKDQIVMSIIRMVGIVVKRDENIDLPLVTYDVRPMSAGDGFIEIVPNCVTLHHIKNELNMDILSWLVEQNPNVTGGELRDRFMKSCAAYCVITYLLGVGDRHLENIMLRSDGAFFHIDYGFILGQDPKPIKKPPIRITEDMLAVLGGLQSNMYKQFQVLCSQINNCLRRHINLFICMLRMFVESHPPIGNFDETLLMDNIRQRFVPGETDEEAEIQLYSHLDKGVSTSYAVIDSLRTIRTPIRTMQTIVTTLWSVTGLPNVISK